MKIGKMGHALGQVTDTYKQAAFFAMVALWILSWFAISVQVFTRRGFGERYASIINLLFGLGAIGSFGGIGNVVISAAANEDLSMLMASLYTFAIALAAYHRLMIWYKNRKGVVWHSMYSGTPLLDFTGISEPFLKRWIEPLMLLALGSLARHSHQPAVAIWLWIGAVAVFVHETLAAYMERSQLLDRRDAFIESNYERDVVDGMKPPNNGFSMSKPSISLLRRATEVQTESALDEPKSRNEVQK